MISDECFQLLSPKINDPTSISKALECSICLAVPHMNPIMTRCDHIFCCECIEESLKHSDECPNCRFVLKDGYKDAWDDRPIIVPLSGPIKNIWRSVPVKCPSSRCSWSGTMENYKSHAARCDRNDTAVRFRKLEQSNEVLGNINATLQEQIERLRGEVDALISEPQDKIDILEYENSELQEENSSLRAGLERTKQELELTRKKSLDWETAYRCLEEDHELQDLVHDHTVDELNEKIYALESQNNELSKHQEGRNKWIADHTKLLQTHLQQINNVIVEEKQEEHVLELSDEIKRLKAENKELKRKHDQNLAANAVNKKLKVDSGICALSEQPKTSQSSSLVAQKIVAPIESPFFNRALEEKEKKLKNFNKGNRREMKEHKAREINLARDQLRKLIKESGCVQNDVASKKQPEISEVLRAENLKGEDGKQNGKSSKSISVHEVLITLYKDGQINRHFDKLERTNFPLVQSKNLNKYKAVMRLVNMAWTMDQKKKLLTDNLSEGDLTDVAIQVEESCMKKMRELEGEGKKRTKPYILGLGNRFLAFEKRRVQEEAQQPGFFTKLGRAMLSTR